MPVILKPHQQKAVDALSDGKVLLGGVGTGKTHTALAYYMKTHSDKDIYVITTARKRDELDWQKTAAQFGVGKEDATVAGTLTVDSWNNIGRYEKVRGAFFIFDEQRLVGKGAWVKTFLSLAKHNPWILLSATPGDSWLDFAPVFIANGFYKNRTDFIRRHVVYKQFSKFPSIDRYVDTGVLTRRRREVVVFMSYARTTTRHVQTVGVGYDHDLYTKLRKKRWNIYEDKPLKDVGELFRVARKLANTDRSRLEKLLELWEKHPRLIVFYNFDYELEMIRGMIGELQHMRTSTTPSFTEREKSDHSTTATSSTSTGRETSWEKLGRQVVESMGGPRGRIDSLPVKKIGSEISTNETSSETLGNSSGAALRTETFEYAEWNGHKHEAVPEGDRWLYLVQYTAGAEAWNCITTDAMVFYSLNYSHKVFEQCQGRIDRLNTPFKDLYYYVFRSNTFIDQAIWKALAAKKSFSERDLNL